MKGSYRVKMFDRSIIEYDNYDDIPDKFYFESEANIPEGKKAGDLKTAAHTKYGLRYTEFISPLIKAVQELSAENVALKSRLDAAGL